MKYYDSMGFESPDGIWARRADVVDIEYSIKLQRLIENLKYDTDTPYPELHHHKMIVAAKARIRELEAALRECLEYIELDSETPMFVCDAWDLLKGSPSSDATVDRGDEA